jgi:hypothetical protein
LTKTAGEGTGGTKRADKMPATEEKTAGEDTGGTKRASFRRKR